MRKGLFFLASVFALLLLSACGNRDVALVKDSYLEGFKTTTIGQALEDFQYFQEKEWVEKKLDNGTREVIFTGTLKPEFYTKGCDLLDKENLASVKEGCVQKLTTKKAEYIITFLINNDESIMVSSIEPTYIFDDGKIHKDPIDKKNINKKIQMIYDNKDHFGEFSPTSSDPQTLIPLAALALLFDYYRNNPE